MFCKTEFQAVLLKMLITLSKAEVRDDTTSNLIYFLVVMALWGNVVSLCAGPTQDSKYQHFSLQRDLVTLGLAQQRIYKGEQAQDQDSPDLSSPQWKPHWMRGWPSSAQPQGDFRGQSKALPSEFHFSSNWSKTKSSPYLSSPGWGNPPELSTSQLLLLSQEYSQLCIFNTLNIF